MMDIFKKDIGTLNPISYVFTIASGVGFSKARLTTVHPSATERVEAQGVLGISRDSVG